jgi:hypothetical protein
MTTWRVTVSGLQGPKLTIARLLILLLHRRIPRRKCGTGHLESILTNQLQTHLLLQLLQKVLREGTISTDPIGRFNWNLPLCWVLFFTSPSYMNPRDFFPDSSAKNAESSNQTPKDEENPSSCGTKSLAHMSKAPSLNNASPGTANPGSCDMENPPSSESVELESTKTTPPNNPSDGIRTVGEDSTSGYSPQPQTQSLPR